MFFFISKAVYKDYQTWNTPAENRITCLSFWWQARSITLLYDYTFTWFC